MKTKYLLSLLPILSLIGFFLIWRELPFQTVKSGVLASQTQPLPSVVQPLEAARVVKVVDGDTIEVNLKGKDEKVRFLGINTPETVDPRKGVECFGPEASEANKKLLTGKNVVLENDSEDQDKYDRLLRYVYLKVDQGNFLFVNDYLVREGYAKLDTFPQNVKHLNQLTQAEQEAESLKKGLWSKCPH
jgi:micrococcal nuclease